MIEMLFSARNKNTEGVKVSLLEGCFDTGMMLIGLIDDTQICSQRVMMTLTLHTITSYMLCSNDTIKELVDNPVRCCKIFKISLYMNAHTDKLLGK
jgi:hypothetical protein